MRIMFDSVTPSNIPKDAAMVAGYIDPGGLFTWSADDYAMFPNAVHVRIAGWASTNDGHVLDVEAGDATPQQAPAWATMRRKAGMSQVTVYCSEAIIGDVLAAFDNQHVLRPLIWRAAYPGGGPVLAAGEVAHQYVDAGPYDISVVADYWPGVDGADIPTIHMEEEMIYSTTDNGAHTYYRDAGGYLVKLAAEEAAPYYGKVPIIELGGGLAALAFNSKTAASLPTPAGTTGLTEAQVTQLIRAELDATKLSHNG